MNESLCDAGPSNLTAACALFRLPVLYLSPSRGCASQRAARERKYLFFCGTNRIKTNLCAFRKESKRSTDIYAVTMSVGGRAGGAGGAARQTLSTSFFGAANVRYPIKRVVYVVRSPVALKGPLAIIRRASGYADRAGWSSIDSRVLLGATATASMGAGVAG